MELHVDDDGFVRAPAAACYRVLTDVAAWSAWWPDTHTTDLGGDRTAIVAGRRGPPDFEVAAHGWRHDQGFRTTLSGGLVGEAEWWLEPGWGGTVVHHLATFTATVQPTGALRGYRRWLRAGFWGCKDHLQAEVLADGGREVTT